VNETRKKQTKEKVVTSIHPAESAIEASDCSVERRARGQVVTKQVIDRANGRDVLFNEIVFIIDTVLDDLNLERKGR
jgi:hypothetical protein